MLKSVLVAQAHTRVTAGARTRASKEAMAGCQSRKLRPTAGLLLPVERAALVAQVCPLHILLHCLAPFLCLPQNTQLLWSRWHRQLCLVV